MAAALATTAKADPGNRMSVAPVRMQNGSAARARRCTGPSFDYLLSYREASNKKTVSHCVWRSYCGASCAKRAHGSCKRVCRPESGANQNAHALIRVHRLDRQICAIGRSSILRRTYDGLDGSALPHLPPPHDAPRAALHRDVMQLRSLALLAVDSGRVNEIAWYGTRGIIEPRAPWLSCTKPYRSMVFSVRERFDFFRPVSSARRASDSGPDSAMIPSRARLRSDKTLAKLSADVNQTFGSSAAGLYSPRAIASVRAFICS